MGRTAGECQMKKPIDLIPAIEQIEHRLFGITEGLIQAVERGETSTAIADVVRGSAEWQTYQSSMADAVQSERPPDGTQGKPLAMPPHIRDLIRRRVATLPLATQAMPSPGQIVRVEEIVTPRSGQFDAVMMVPLHVLLDAPAEVPEVWHGWLVSGEADYAGWWDDVLQEEDASFDPEAGMVQVWNPVRLYLPMAKRVVGFLPPASLQAVRALAAEFVTTEAPTDIAPWPGKVAMRTTTGGLSVATGSPLGESNDPRHRYQEIYFEAAEAVREPARLALRELAKAPASTYDFQSDTTSPTDDLWYSITRGMGSIIGWIAPEPSPQISYAALSGSRSFRFRFNDQLDGSLDVKICAEDSTVELVPDIHGDPTGWFLVIADVATGINLLTAEGAPAIPLAKYYPGPISIPAMQNVDDVDARMVKFSAPA